MEDLFWIIYGTLSTVDSNHVLFFASLFYALSCSTLSKILLRRNSIFRSLSKNRRFYVVSNILKSGVLCFISYIFAQGLWLGVIHPFVVEGGWRSADNFLCCIHALYTTTDLVSLLIGFEKMPITTKFHHICVILSYGYCITADVDRISIYQAIIIYGGFSSFAFPVNMFLGIRNLSDGTAKNFLINERLRIVSLISYILACSLNWGWQFWFLSKIFTQIENWRNLGSAILYSMILYHWVHDDIVLIRFLRKKSVKRE